MDTCKTEGLVADGFLVTFHDYARKSGGLSTPELLNLGWDIIRRSSEAKFPLGRLIISPAAAEGIPLRDSLRALLRHQLGDWGELEEEDKRQNELALLEGARLFSVYRATQRRTRDHQVRFYVITEWNREATTLLLPEDY